MSAPRRLAAIALATGLAACGGASKHGPAWPKSAGDVVPDTWQEDGGESLEPHVADDRAAVERSDQTMGSDTPDATQMTIEVNASTPAPPAPDPAPEPTDDGATSP